jgi:outer membrane receptor protein involved in Fe transport
VTNHSSPRLERHGARVVATATEGAGVMATAIVVEAAGVTAVPVGVAVTAIETRVATSAKDVVGETSAATLQIVRRLRLVPRLRVCARRAHIVRLRSRLFPRSSTELPRRY